MFLVPITSFVARGCGLMVTGVKSNVCSTFVGPAAFGAAPGIGGYDIGVGVAAAGLESLVGLVAVGEGLVECICPDFEFGAFA